MYPANSQYERNLIPDSQNEIECLVDVHPMEEVAKQSFLPRTLRLSTSFPSLGHQPSNSSPAQKWKDGFMKARSTSLSVSSEDELSSSSDPSIHPLQHSKTLEQLLRQSRPSAHRLRTRSLDRRSKAFITSSSSSTTNTNLPGHKASLSHGFPDLNPSSSFPSQYGTRQLVGFHTHIPIEHTVLSVLPSSRKSSIDSMASVTRVPPLTDDSPHGSSLATSSGSPSSTLGTSIDSSGPPSRPRYQPRPLLLSAFGSKKQGSNKIFNSADQKSNPKQAHDQALNQEVTHARRLADAKLEKAQQIRQQKLHAREAKQLRKRAREAELSAISGSLSKVNDSSSISELKDSDCWSWLSASDVDEPSEDEEAEEIAVVWRASLDVGRRVSKDRKALGKGHGIRLPPRNSHSSSVAKSSKSSTRLTKHSHSDSWWGLHKLHNLLPHPLINIFQNHNSFKTPFRALRPGFFLFGSGLMSGVACSVLCSALSSHLPSFLQRGLLPVSSCGIGLFFNLIFPRSPLDLHGTSMSFLSPGSIVTSVGLLTQW